MHRRTVGPFSGLLTSFSPVPGDSRHSPKETIDVTDRYVNYLGFNLADPHTLAGTQDPTWDRTNFDWLISIQRRFWADIERLEPSSYVCSGDADIVVTRDPTFIARIREIVG